MFTPQHPSYPKVPQPPKVNVGGRDYAIDKVVLHPDWDTKSLPNDIALLRLAEPVAGIVPIRIYRKQDEVGAIVTFVGRGYPGTGKEGVKTKDLILRARSEE